MTQYTLTMLDTSGIKKDIFNSNRLQENIGALVRPDSRGGDFPDEK
jgi:hypothetical protein